MIRLFIACKIPQEIIEDLLATCKKIAPDQEEHRWETLLKIHLTLKFIGEVEETILEEICKEIEFIENYEGFEFSVTQFGFFFRDNQPKILWAGLETHKSIYNLVEELNRRLSRFSIPIEKRKFKPHLTLLRVKFNPGGEFINNFKHYSFDNYKFASKEIALVESRLLKTGAQYIDIKKYKLK